MKNKFILTSLALLSACVISSCSDDTVSTTAAGTVPAVYNKIYGAYSITSDGTYITVKVHSRPDHRSPYYIGTQWESTLYEAYNGSNPNWSQNSNHISQFDLTFKIPVSPSAASTHQSTPLGPMGISLNGVPFFNQYAMGGQPLTGEINSFDQYGGHPSPNSQYHYHVEPYYLTTNNGEDALLGFLLDGFPVYGPMENGHTMTNDSLDSYHGHFGVTADYPNGIYHYHITDASPYINGDGFYGTPGTVTQ